MPPIEGRYLKETLSSSYISDTGITCPIKSEALVFAQVSNRVTKNQ